MDFDSIGAFKQYAINKIQQCGTPTLEDIKTKAIEIMNDGWFSKYNPSEYNRIGDMVNAFKIVKSPTGDGIELRIDLEDREHMPSNWVGGNYPLSEIILDYMPKSHTYVNEKSRPGVNIKEKTESYTVAEGLQHLLDELKKYFDIV